MKVVVTGATGFVGRHTVRKLLDSGYEVVSITTKNTISEYVKGYINGSDVITVNALAEVSEDSIRNNIIIHCAWDNVQNTVDVSHYLHAVEQVKFISKIALFKPEKVIITGTCYEFGLRTGPVSVADRTQPNTPYAQAKDFVRLASEKILRDDAKIDFIWARLFYLYGVGQHEKSIYSQLITAINRKDRIFNMSKGEQLYDYMNVEDLAEKLASLATVKAPSIVHICNGYPTSLRTIAENILLEKKSSLQLNFGFYPYRKQDSIALWGAESFASQVVGNSTLK
jgi:nucleoside-diphosphate-sugar epimerase